MKAIICLFALFAIVIARPQGQREGYTLRDEAIRTAQNSLLIPKDAVIQNVQDSVQLGAYEGIPIGQHVEIRQLLGDLIPEEVANNLQSRFDAIGRDENF